MNNILNFSWRSVLLVTLGITTIIILFTFVPILARKEHTMKATQIDILLHRGNPPDYSIYLATITMGQAGKPYFRNYFSPTETKKLPILSFYWITGLLTGPFHMWQPYAYHLARILTVLSFGVALYVLTRSVFSSPWQGMTAAIIALLMPIMPQMFYHQEITKSFHPWWNLFLSPVNRLDPPPHHLAAQAFLLLSIACYMQYRKKHRVHIGITSTLMAILSLLMVPQTVLPYLLMVLVDMLSMAYTAYRLKSKDKTIQSLWSLAFIIMTLIPLLVLSLVLRDPIWSKNQIWEMNYWARDPYFYYHLYVSFLPLALFAIPSFVLSVSQKNTTRLLIAFWAITPLLALPFTHLLGVGTGRLVQNVIHIPLTLLSVFTVTDAMKKQIIPKFAPIVVIGLLIFYGMTTFPSDAKTQWDSFKNQEYTWWYYLPKSVYEAVDWIKNNLPTDSKLISIEGVGNPIVSFAPVIVYQGDQTHGYNWDLDLSKVYLFYMRTISDADALAWLNSLGIRYVVDDTRRAPDSFYPFLTQVWSNSAMRIYKVQK